MIREQFLLPLRKVLLSWLRLRERAGLVSIAMALISGFGLTAAQVQAQYTAQLLPPPTVGQPPGEITPYALNNAGQVFGRNFWGTGNPNRGPVLWTNAVPAALPLPAGYHFYDIGIYFLNDMGVAVSTVQLDSATVNEGIRAVVWRNGAATVVPVPLSSDECGSRFSNLPPGTHEFNVLPGGLNRAGHMLINACNSLWIVDSSGAVLTAGPPPVVVNNALTPPYFEEPFNNINHLNDADVASAETGVYGFNLGTHPGILSGLSSFFPLPMDHGYAHDINNRDQVLTFIQDPATAHCYLWNGAVLVDLGTTACGGASLNNLGQVAFMTNSNQPLLYKDGVVSPIILPAEAPDLLFSGGSGLNDAGQIIGQEGFSGVLLTPSGPCAVAVTSQTAVTRGGFRYNRTTEHYTQTISVENTGASTLATPISIALDNVPATATPFNITGATSCNPPAGSFHLDLPVSLAPDAIATGIVEFIDTAAIGITYDTRVLSGTGRR